MSTGIGEKLVLIRKSEYLTREQFAITTGIPMATLRSYETGRSVPPVDTVMKMLNTPKFSKYMLWFMSDSVAPESGQIAPALAHFGQDETGCSASGKKTG
ncbi:MAG: helix-turn-helix domain-containing protein [Aeromonas hydrophila]